MLSPAVATVSASLPRATLFATLAMALRPKARDDSSFASLSLPKAAALVFSAFVLLPMAMVSVAVNPPSTVLACLPIAILSLPVIEFPAS